MSGLTRKYLAFCVLVVSGLWMPVSLAAPLDASNADIATTGKSAKKAELRAGLGLTVANANRALEKRSQHASELGKYDVNNERHREMAYASAVLVANGVSFAVADLRTKTARAGRDTGAGREFIEIARELNAAGLHVMEAAAPDGRGRPSASREKLVNRYEELKRIALELASR